MTELYVNVLGQGPRVILVHGSGGSSDTWARQLPLAARFKLLMLDRRGYGRSPPASCIDYETDAADIVDLLDSGAHIVGWSYGGVGSLIAAGLKPESVLSLTVVEPPVFGLVRGYPEIESMTERLRQVYATMRNASPEEFAVAFNQAVGFDFLPTELNPKSRKSVETIMKERQPMDAQLPIKRLSTSSFPKLVISGGWSDSFETVCNELAKRIGAFRVIIQGEGHNVPRTGEPFNRCLEKLFRCVTLGDYLA